MVEGNSSTTARVRVLPGSTLSLSNPPPPPSQPPPPPVHLCKIAVVGNPSSGKSSLVNKFLTRKSAASSAVNINITNGGGGDNNSAAAAAAVNDMTIQWCNASATSNGTFGSALGASLIGPIGSGSSGGVGGTSEHTATLAEYYKKDISLKRRGGGGRRSRRNEKQQQQQEDQTQSSTTTCVRVQVWDINVPIQQPHFNSDNDNNNNHNNNNNNTNNLNNSPDYIKSTSSITSPSQHSQQINNNSNRNNNNDVTNSLLAPLLPLLKRINGIIIACQCPLPPTTTAATARTSSSLIYSSNASHASYNTQSSIRSGEWYWEELDLLEEQIATWIQFVSRRGDDGENGANVNGAAVKNDGSNSNNKSNNTIIVILTYADMAITEYSPKEWMKLSVKMDEICKKFGIHSWRMGTCVSSSENNNSGNSGGDSGSGNKSELNNADGRNAKEEEEMNNNFISRQQQHQYHYGLFQRMAIQQQRLLEDMEDSVEGTFIDLILSHIDK